MPECGFRLAEDHPANPVACHFQDAAHVSPSPVRLRLRLRRDRAETK
jgi:hypothetical protein